MTQEDIKKYQELLSKYYEGCSPELLQLVIGELREYTTKDAAFKYRVIGYKDIKAVKIVDYDSFQADVVIPKIIEGLPVISFNFNENHQTVDIKSITIHDTVIDMYNNGENKIFNKLEKIVFDGDINLKEEAFRRVINYNSRCIEPIEYVFNNDEYKVESECILSKDGKTLYKVTNRGTVTIPNGVEKIYYRAINSYRLVKATLTFPNTIIEIDDKGITMNLDDFCKYSSLPMNVEKAGACLITKNPSPLQIVDDKIIIGKSVKEITAACAEYAYKNDLVFVPNDNFVIDNDCLFNKEKTILYCTGKNADAKILENLENVNIIDKIGYDKVIKDSYEIASIGYGRYKIGKYVIELDENNRGLVCVIEEADLILNDNFIIENHMLLSKDKTVLYKIYKVESVIDFEIPSTVITNFDQSSTKRWMTKKNNLLAEIKSAKNDTEPRILKTGSKYSLINPIVADRVEIPNTNFDTKTVNFVITQSCLGIKELILPEGVTKFEVDESCYDKESRLEILQLPSSCAVTQNLMYLEGLKSLMLLIITPEKKLRMYRTLSTEYIIASTNKFSIPYYAHGTDEAEYWDSVLVGITSVSSFDRSRLYVDDKAYYYYQKSKKYYQLLKVRNIDNYVVPSKVNGIKVGSIANFALNKVCGGKVTLNNNVTLLSSSLNEMHYETDLYTSAGKVEKKKEKVLYLDSLTKDDVISSINEEYAYCDEHNIDYFDLTDNDLLIINKICEQKFQKIKAELIQNKDKIKGSLSDYIDLHYFRGLNGSFQDIVYALTKEDLINEDYEEEKYLRKKGHKYLSYYDVDEFDSIINAKVKEIKADLIKNENNIDCSLYEYIEKHYKPEQKKYYSYDVKTVSEFKNLDVDVEEVIETAIQTENDKKAEIIEEPIEDLVNKEDNVEKEIEIKSNDDNTEIKQISPKLKESINHLKEFDLVNFTVERDKYLRSHDLLNKELTKQEDKEINELIYQKVKSIKEELIENYQDIPTNLKKYVKEKYVNSRYNQLYEKIIHLLTSNLFDYNYEIRMASLNGGKLLTKEEKDDLYKNLDLKVEKIKNKLIDNIDNIPDSFEEYLYVHYQKPTKQQLIVEINELCDSYSFIDPDKEYEKYKKVNKITYELSDQQKLQVINAIEDKLLEIKFDLINNIENINCKLEDYVNKHYKNISINYKNHTKKQLSKKEQLIVDICDYFIFNRILNHDEEVEKYKKYHNISQELSAEDTLSIYFYVDKRIEDVKAELIANVDLIDCDLEEYINKHYKGKLFNYPNMDINIAPEDINKITTSDIFDLDEELIKYRKANKLTGNITPKQQSAVQTILDEKTQSIKTELIDNIGNIKCDLKDYIKAHYSNVKINYYDSTISAATKNKKANKDSIKSKEKDFKFKKLPLVLGVVCAVLIIIAVIMISKTKTYSAYVDLKTNEIIGEVREEQINSKDYTYGTSYYHKEAKTFRFFMFFKLIVILILEIICFIVTLRVNDKSDSLIWIALTAMIFSAFMLFRYVLRMSLECYESYDSYGLSYVRTDAGYVKTIILMSIDLIIYIVRMVLYNHNRQVEDKIMKKNNK